MSEAAADGEPVFDLTEIIPPLADVRGHLEAHQWSDASNLLHALAERGEDQLSIASEAISGVEGIEQDLAEIIRANPESLLARTLLAHRMARLAWDVRSAPDVPEEDAEPHDAFTRQLRAVELELIEICALAPQQTLPWSLRVMTARGLEMGTSEARRRYQRLTRLSPHHFWGQQQMLQKLSPAWGGSWDSLFEFAQECAASAPSAAASKAALAAAHFETAIQMKPAERAGYFSDPDVRTDLVSAAEESVHHPAFSGDLHEVSLHSLFAAVWSMAGEPAMARVHFDALGPAASETWFGRFKDPVAVYHQYRSAAVATGVER